MLRALDLHVLGLPPAFALSQDQTLKLDENFIPADHNVSFDEVPPFIACTICIAPAIIGVDLKRVPPKSRPTALLPRMHLSMPPPVEEAVRKDSAVHVSLSSDSLVKQPGARLTPFPASRKADETTASEPYRRPFLDKSEELLRRATEPVSGRRAVWRGYMGCALSVSTEKPEIVALHSRGDPSV